MMLVRLTATIVFATLASGGEFWVDKQPDQWSKEEVERLLTHSPWAKQVKASMDHTRLPAGSRGGGRVPGGGGGYGMGMPSPGVPAPDMPVMRATIRWESAPAIRDGSKKPLPANAAGHYVLSVSGLPMMPIAENRDSGSGDPMLEELRASTTLSARSKPAIALTAVHVDKATGVMYLYFKLDDDRFQPADKEIHFKIQLGPFGFQTKFLLKEMTYRGKLTL